MTDARDLGGGPDGLGFRVGSTVRASGPAQGPGSPLLDIGTQLHRGPWRVTVWPTCDEATLVPVAGVSRFSRTAVQERRARARAEREARGEFPYSEAVAVARREAQRWGSVRRSRSAVRRYQRHNGLSELVTFTFAGAPPEVGSLGHVVDLFWRRWTRATGVKPGPYVWVPEWGSESGRLHVHMGVRWWSELGCVEVCERCARDELRRVRSDIPPEGSLCVGCLWGHGFVGRPDDDASGRGLSRYLAKYLGKDLGSGLGAGAQRYRVAQGFSPAPVRVVAQSPDEGVSFAVSQMCARQSGGTQTPIMSVLPPGDGPGCLFLDWRAVPQ